MAVRQNETAETRIRVFISYSHKDEAWKDRVVTHVKALVHEGDLVLWDDRMIGTGDDWYPKIKEELEKAHIAICLISADYLASDFIKKEEIPAMKRRRKDEGMLLLPLLLSPCPWKVANWLRGIQMFPRDCVSLEEVRLKVDRKKALADFVVEISERIAAEDFATPAPAPASGPPDKVDISRLPATGAELFGREKELQLLDKMWNPGSANVVSLVAWGGVGKSTLVNQWLQYLEADNYRGAKRVFGWSFYSQGTGQRVTSADQFMSEALTWFGDPDPKQGSPWDKGQRLADLVRQGKTLLILDGLEPLQSGFDFDKGKINDPALSVLVTRLARQNNGLCVITTREKVAELDQFEASVRQLDLEQISKEAGRALLNVGGVRGTDEELEAASEAFGNHALAVGLLATYLHGIEGHHVSNVASIPDLDIPEAKGRHPRRVMNAFEERFAGTAQNQVLRIMGLFDRPADAEAIEAVKAPPPIPKLTDELQVLTEGQWRDLLDELRCCRLLAPQSRRDANAIDCHPLVREHFGEKLAEEDPESYRDAQLRLYNSYKRLGERLCGRSSPDSLERMEPFFMAVAHACLAGQYEDARRLYARRIKQRAGSYVADALGAIGAELAVLSHFFVSPWSRVVVKEGFDHAFVQAVAGVRLKAAGRLPEAKSNMEEALRLHVGNGAWTHASNTARHLSNLYLALGHVDRAIEVGGQSAEWARRPPRKSWFRDMATLSSKADSCHQAGYYGLATTCFEEAERKQVRARKDLPFLYGLQGCRYCDLLVAKADLEGFDRRILEMLKRSRKNNFGLGVAMAHVYWARSDLLRGRPVRAERRLGRGIRRLRKASQIDKLILGLLAGAEIRRCAQGFDGAWSDLEEARGIAEQYGMNLYLADYHLEAARLCLAQADAGGSQFIVPSGIYEGAEARGVPIASEARKHWQVAAKQVDEMGYHRREPEVLLIEAELEFVEGHKALAEEKLAEAEKRIRQMGCRRWEIEVERLRERFG